MVVADTGSIQAPGTYSRTLTSGASTSVGATAIWLVKAAP